MSEFEKVKFCGIADARKLGLYVNQKCGFAEMRLHPKLPAGSVWCRAKNDWCAGVGGGECPAKLDIPTLQNDVEISYRA